MILPSLLRSVSFRLTLIYMLFLGVRRNSLGFLISGGCGYAV